MAGLHIQANIKWLQHLGGDLYRNTKSHWVTLKASSSGYSAESVPKEGETAGFWSSKLIYREPLHSLLMLLYSYSALLSSLNS